MQQSPSAYAYQQSSPLETLVRRASSRKVAAGRPGRPERPVDLNLSRSPSPSPPTSPVHDDRHYEHHNPIQYAQDYRSYNEPHNGYNNGHGGQYYHQEHLGTPQKTVGSRRPPSSPLLHTQFRSSTATTLTQFDNSFDQRHMQTYSQYVSEGNTMRHGDPHPQRVVRDDESVYSEASYGGRHSAYAIDEDGESHDAHYMPPPRLRERGRHDTVDDFSSFYRQSNFTPDADAPPPPPIPSNAFAAAPQRPPPMDSVPKVVVSEAPMENHHPSASGRMRSAVPTEHMNFSRPRGPPITPPPSGPLPTASPHRGMRPELPPRMTTEENKRAVIERNMNRTPSTSRLRPGGSPSTPGSPLSTPSTPRSAPGTPGSQHGMLPPALIITAPPPAHGPPGGNLSVAPQNSTRSRSPSVSSQPSPSPSPNGSRTDLSRSPSPSYAPAGPDGRVVLSGRPPSPANGGSPASLYSAYSFYQLESPGGASAPSSRVPSPSSQAGAGRPAASSATLVASQSAPNAPLTAEDYVQLGIQHHEADRLRESAECFEKAATTGGGSGAGMLMWGLALRHGWGTAKDEKGAFKWLRRAAESATDDLEKGRVGKGQERDALKVR